MTDEVVDDLKKKVVLRCELLVKRYGDVVALDGLDLSIRQGECFGLLGPNGAGKTTTVEILEGLTAPDSGIVELLGMRWGQGKDHLLRSRIGVQLQETQLADKLTVEETIRLFRSFYKQGREVEQVLLLLGLEQKRKGQVHQLSGGLRQRLALACALVSQPDILFLDEPTTGLDPQARLRIWEVIEHFRNQGGTVLLTTHYMEEAAHLCDRVAILDQGRLLTEGSPATLIDSLQAEQIVEFETEEELPQEALSALEGVRQATRQNGRCILRVAPIGRALPSLFTTLEQHHITLKSLATHQPSLEDVFVSYTGRGLRDD